MQSSIIEHHRDGSQPFKGRGHLRNMMRYFLSRSKGHPETDRTHLNYFEVPDTGAFFNTNPRGGEQVIDAQIASLDHTRLENDLFTLGFVVFVDGQSISSFLRSGHKEAVDIVDPEGFEVFLERAFRGDVEEMEAWLGTVVAAAGPIRHIDDTPAEAMLQVEHMVHASLPERDRCLVSLSHRDQPDRPYHIHRLLFAER